MTPLGSTGYSRREFLKQMACAGVGSTTLYSLLANLAITGRASAETLRPDSRYRALVCLFLEGGNDSFNMLAPLEPAEFARYQAARSDLALARESLLAIKQTSGAESGRSFGLHPSMSEIRELYDAGALSFICNVGTLVEPTTRATLEAHTARLPIGLYSHADQVTHWQTAMPEVSGSTGWAGRAAEVLQAMNENQAISMNISLSGTNVFQCGKRSTPYAITPDGVVRLKNYEDPAPAFFRKAADSMFEQHYQNLLKQQYADVTRDALRSSEVVDAAWRAAPRVQTAFPDTPLGRNLRGVAQCMAARDNLKMKRQTYFVRYGGWDHHDEVLASQATMLAQVSQAVGAFWRALGELGLQDDVVLFTASDFGRTLSSNGKGSDHGWGGHQFVLGGAQRGGRLYGRYPEDLSLGNALDTGRGRLIPTMAVDEYFGELALWLGVKRSDLTYALPNIERFYSLSSEKTPLGLFA